MILGALYAEILVTAQGLIFFFLFKEHFVQGY